MNDSLAIVAGEGRLPLAIAARLRSAGRTPVVYALCGEPSAYSEMGCSTVPLAGPDIELVLQDMKTRNIKKILLAGVVPKSLIFHPERLDDLTVSMLKRMEDRNDHALLSGIISILEAHGIKVAGYRDIVPDLLAAEGLIAGRTPSEEELADVTYGWNILARILPLSFGQSLVVSKRSVVAVEAMEGTDGMIARSGDVAGRGVLVKGMRADQDDRYDLPTVGPKTLENMARAGLTCLAVEEGRTLILDADLFRARAVENDISVVGIKSCPSL